MQGQPSLVSVGVAPHGAHPSVSSGRTGRPTLTVVHRAVEPASNRFCLRDRVELLGWAARARVLGISRVSLEHPEPQDSRHEIGDFALIYNGDADWAAWGIGREHGRYLLWSPNTGQTVGHFPSLAAALSAILAADC